MEKNSLYVCRCKGQKNISLEKVKEQGHQDPKTKVGFPATISANQGFSLSGYRPIRLLGVGNSANQGFLVSGYGPIRFSGV